jgi:peptide/nickel transport system ATP-binding protein
VEAVRGVSLRVAPGERLGIAGESGSGKTVSALAITGLLPASARATGRVRFAGTDVGALRSPQRTALRGRHVGTILQDPLDSLNPALTVGSQIVETLRRHEPLDRAAARRRAIELLGQVGIPDAARNVDEYPHRFSGGMRQRAMIAIALSVEPEVIVADEPTTALDVTVQAQILELLVGLCEERTTALLLITHDLGVLAGVAHRIAIMHEGRVVEEAAVDDLFDRPAHPYTRSLLASIPRPDDTARPAVDPGDRPLLEVQQLTKDFPILRGGAIRRAVGSVRAVEDVTLTIAAGETLALVGESGCGKSTLARCVLRLVESSSGGVRFDGHDVLACDRRALRRLRRDIQLVFQDPYGSLDPRMTVAQLVGEPLAVHELGGDRHARAARVRELLGMVGLGPEHASRHPHAFSGGQRQRIAIARALATEPKLLVLDEPVSALDTSTRAQILALLGELQQRLGVSYLLIAHDLALVRAVAHRVAVMYLGRIVELGACAQIFATPAHPYTQALLSAVPIPDPRRERERRRIVLRGEAQTSPDAGTGCPFAPRCVHVQERCLVRDPPLAPVRGSGAPHSAACVLVMSENDDDQEVA